MKINIDLNFPIKGLDDKEIPDSNAGKLLGNMLASNNKGDALKYYDWGRSLYKGNVIEVDRSDFDTIEKFIKESEQLSNLVKAQISICLKESLDKSKVSETK